MSERGGAIHWLDGRLRQEGLWEGGISFALLRATLRGVAPVVDGLVALRVSPDALSIASVVWAALASWAILQGRVSLAAFCLVISGACDLLDGWVARARRISSAAGEVLDTLCDRISEVLILTVLGFVWLKRGEGAAFREWGVLGALIALSGALMMSFASALVQGKLKGARGFFRRPERAVFTVFSVLLLNALPGVSVSLLWVMGLGAMSSATLRLVAFRKSLMQSQKGPNATPGSELDVQQEEERWLAPGIQGLTRLSRLEISHARGVTLVSRSGQELIDWVGGIGVASLGHSHPRWIEAISAQAGRYAVGSLSTEIRARYLKLLMENAAPPGADCVQLYSGGAEAVESALRLAQEATGKRRIAHFHGSFHGKTRGVLGLMGSDWKKPWGPYGDLAPLALPYADCNRCPYQLEPRSCGLACAQEAAQRIQESASDLAAVIIEPMQGTAGNIIPPLGFLNQIEKATRDAGALLIADEMITGFGRTGRFWGIEQSRIYPDITTAGKGMAAGFPISAVFTRKSVCVRAPSWSAPSGSSSSFGANSLACAAALATLEVILDQNCVHQARVRGFEFLGGLQQLARRYPTAIRAVRGQGMLLGVDLDEAIVRDGKLFQNALNEGLFTMAYTSRLRIQPPLIISSEEIAESLNRFERALIATLP